MKDNILYYVQKENKEAEIFFTEFLGTLNISIRLDGLYFKRGKEFVMFYGRKQVSLLIDENFRSKYFSLCQLNFYIKEFIRQMLSKHLNFDIVINNIQITKLYL